PGCDHGDAHHHGRGRVGLRGGRSTTHGPDLATPGLAPGRADGRGGPRRGAVPFPARRTGTGRCRRVHHRTVAVLPRRVRRGSDTTARGGPHRGGGGAGAAAPAPFLPPRQAEQ